MFDFQDSIQKFRTHMKETGTTYNDARDYGVTIDTPQNHIWRVLGIHHLTPEENRGGHNVFVEMLCKQNEREAFRAIHWTWEGRLPHQIAPDVFAGQKPLNELIDIPLNLGMIVSVWTNGSEIAQGFSSNHPDEGQGNTIGHHSFFVCLQEMGGVDPDPDPDPPTAGAAMMIKKSWIDEQPVDDDGYIRIKE